MMVIEEIFSFKNLEKQTKILDFILNLKTLKYL